ncbi:SDR family oxidoreductase [Candidatus Nitrosotenuis cloacae]|uniref:SDR family oxidoreductase n=1 Tax=Candidatus Nitrosotenuis cloacae TaxID=1603555 RepID=UPI00227E3641|nr:SDR family oxidoreductase [Candidatus Nitrosotenuis cloacae]
MPQKILVVGAGFLGSKIANEFSYLKNSVIKTNLTSVQDGSHLLDITNKKMVEDCFEKIKPDIVVNCAGSTDIDFLEKNSQLAYAVNGQSVKNLAVTSQKFNSRFIQISTDGVFDGIYGNYSETDIPNPVNVYAKSKLIGEEETGKNCQNYTIIRTNFYGHHKSGRFLFNNILNKLKAGVKIIGFDDIFFTPLEISNLSQLVVDVALSEYIGILNLSSDYPISKYQFCLNIAEILGFDTKLIRRGSIDEMNFAAKRPKNTSLVNKRSKQIIRHEIVSLTDWLERYKKQLNDSFSHQP